MDDTDPGAFARAPERRHASFRLNGTKPRGDYALTRFRGGDRFGGGDGGARHGRAAPGSRRARSARTGRTPRQVVRADVPGWGAR
ncbi:hypothetical protein [Streptomyces sp. NPDC056937]|uniref:hypothetical protein n=1 Tax=Streptomyces sp. NPDC056937 TaxID=3345969 RepID=UPI0036328E18